MILAASTALLPFVDAPWQLYAVYILMSSGWLTMGIPAITTIVSYWFEERRGLAISLALNGASFGGILLAPALVFLIEAVGFTAAMLAAAAIMLAVLVPSTLLWIDRPPDAGQRALDGSPAEKAAAPVLTRAAALRSLAFWTVAAPFALALLAQVGFLVHLIAFLEPITGRAQAGLALVVTTVMAVIGRLGLGGVIDRIEPRRVTAASLVSQAVALFLMTQTLDPKTLLACCAFYGLSVGNLITLPALVIHRELPPSAFGMLIGLVAAIMGVVSALGPGLVGMARDATGSYTAGIGLCIALALAAAGIVLLRPSAGETLSRP
jgi:predicted MFS family arabinose efflux permease